MELWNCGIHGIDSTMELWNTGIHEIHGIMEYCSLTKISFSRTLQKGSVDVKKLPRELKCGKKDQENSTKPKMVLHLERAKEPSLGNFCKFRTKPKKVSHKIDQTPQFCTKRTELITNH